jgi:hypothetical protein
MKARKFIVLIGALILTGCDVVSPQHADQEAVGRSGVSPVVYDKMVHGAPLTVDDVIALTHAGVSDAIITRYVHDHTLIYHLSKSDSERLRRGGVSPTVITYMNETPHYDWRYPKAGPYLTPFGRM